MDKLPVRRNARATSYQVDLVERELLTIYFELTIT